MIEKWINWYQNLLSGAGLSESLVVLIENATIIVVTVGLAILADFIIKRIIITTITRIARKSKNRWDDIFIERRVFNRLAHIAPAIIVYSALQYIFDAPSLVKFMENVTQVYMILVVLLVIDATINAFHGVYLTTPVSKGRNIKGYIQVIKIMIYFFV